MIEPVARPSKLICEFVIFCKPQPLGRPRKSRDGKSVYSPTKNQEQARHQLAIAYGGEQINRPVFVEINFFFENANLDFITRADVDNLAKAQLDNFQIVDILKNDNLVVGLLATKNSSQFQPYFHTRIFTVETSKLPNRLCGGQQKGDSNPHKNIEYFADRCGQNNHHQPLVGPFGGYLQT